eukprot:32628-Chlamydomonas_euryale.AAC.1
MALCVFGCGGVLCGAYKGGPKEPTVGDVAPAGRKASAAGKGASAGTRTLRGGRPFCRGGLRR